MYSAGNFRVDNESRYPALTHFNEKAQQPPRANNNDFRNRSKSPRTDYTRVDSSSGGGVAGGRVSGGGGGGSMVTPSLAVGGAGGDDSVSLLLNLSQMLR